MKKLFYLLVLISLQSCGSWGSKTRFGETYPPNKVEKVEVLRFFPNEPYKEIGAVSAIGGAWSSSAELVNKLRKASADLGADAVVLGSKGSTSLTTGGGASNTQGQVNVVGNTAYYNQTTTQSGPQTYNYPTYEGIAIRYIKNDQNK